MNSHERQFVVKLKALLEKYNASIAFDFGEGSDTHGIYDERIALYVAGNKAEVLSVSGYQLDPCDLDNIEPPHLETPTYTAFCQSISGRGTIWIQAIDAPGVPEARERAIEACADDWDCLPEEIHFLGLAVGDIEIADWHDLDD